jgi:heme iron utilization protein
MSTLAWHTKNLIADPRASVMVAEIPESGDALTGPRVTVLGRLERSDEVGLRTRYLEHHPYAELYAGFGDFSFWLMAPSSVHCVAGFGRIETLTPEEVFAA